MHFPLLLVGLAISGLSDTRHSEWESEPVRAMELPASLGQRLSEAELATLSTAQPLLPFPHPRVGLKLPDGTLWVGSAHGLMHRPAQSGRWRLFHSRRWLPADDVLDLAIPAEGVVVVKTSAGFGKLVARETTLNEKMTYVTERALFLL